MISYEDRIKDLGTKPAIIAHRGEWSDAPENSIAAVLAALAAGAQAVEIDLQQSRDGVLVVVHDKTTRRCTGADLTVAESDFAALKALELYASDGRSKQKTDHKIPSFAELLAATKGQVYFDLDLKRPELQDAVINAVQAAGAEPLVCLKFTAETDEDFARLKALQAQTGIAIKPMVTFTQAHGPERLAAVLKAKPFMVECHFERREDLQTLPWQMRRAGIAVWVNTIDVSHAFDFNDSRALREPNAVWGQLRNWGVNAIQTDQTAACAAFYAKDTTTDAL